MRDDKLTQPGYQPKGSMCAGCESSDVNCSALPFHTMPVIGGYWGIKIVRCTQYKPATNERFTKWRGFVP